MGYNVLSLFDGMPCGLTALKRAGIPVGMYFASEVDKYAIQIAQKNHPEIIQLGDVTGWKSWKLPKIDLIIGGSPCQGFSFAGKQLNFNDPRSALFFKYVDCVQHFKPRWFLLENVRMKAAHRDVISGALMTTPIEVNSALVSAQNRRRLYWCNWDVDQPRDLGILLRDIIDGYGYVRDHGEWRSTGDKSLNIDANYHKGVDNHGQRTMVGSQDQRAFYLDGKHGTLSTGAGNKSKVLLDKCTLTFRKLTPIECERLQTLPDNYTEGVSNTQRYKMLGNGWTVDVITHILRSIPNVI